MFGQSKAIYYHNPANGRSIDMLVLVPVTPGPGRGALLMQHWQWAAVGLSEAGSEVQHLLTTPATSRPVPPLQGS